MAVKNETATPSIPPGSAAVSTETACAVVGNPDRSLDSLLPAHLAEAISALDTFLNVMLTREKMFVLNLDDCLEEELRREFVTRCPAMPIELSEGRGPLEVGSDDESDEIYDFMATAVEEIMVERGFRQFMNVFGAELPREGLIDKDKPCRFDPNTETIRVQELCDYVAEWAELLPRAMINGIPFFANQKESPHCFAAALTQVLIPGDEDVPSRLSIEQLKKVWYQEADEINKEVERDLFTIEMPLFLMAVLRECKEPQDLWSVASQMRESRESRNFREWAVSLDNAPDGEAYLTAKNQATKVAADFRRVLGKGVEEAGIEVSISLAGPAISKLIRFLPRSPWWRNRHLRFMKRLFRSALKGRKLEAEVQRVFGVRPRIARQAVQLLDGFGRHSDPVNRPSAG